MTKEYTQEEMDEAIRVMDAYREASGILTVWQVTHDPDEKKPPEVEAALDFMVHVMKYGTFPEGYQKVA